MHHYTVVSQHLFKSNETLTCFSLNYPSISCNKKKFRAVVLNFFCRCPIKDGHPSIMDLGCRYKMTFTTRVAKTDILWWAVLYLVSSTRGQSQFGCSPVHSWQHRCQELAESKWGLKADLSHEEVFLYPSEYFIRLWWYRIVVKTFDTWEIVNYQRVKNPILLH